MKSLLAKIQHLLKFPPHLIVQKVVNRIHELWFEKRDRNRITKTDLRTTSSANMCFGKFKLSWLDSEHVDNEVFAFFGNMYLDHRFNILGSSWIRNSYSSKSPGVEGHLYLSEIKNEEFDKSGDWLRQIVQPEHLPFSQKCWQIISRLNPTYEPIDWQKDVKSGFRWDAKIWFRGQRKLSDGKLGVDIKVPWELSRLQHLIKMIVWAQKRPEKSQIIINEILCQIIDFIMSNPIGMGANFNCPMDIGIRNANLLIAYDLLKQLDIEAISNHNIDQMVAGYIHLSSRHILDDIEYREGKTSNHYLGNVLGILYAGLYLNVGDESNQFLAFGLQELNSSIFKQFFEDGGNFEGSTAYHRLSGEMMAYGSLAALLADNEQLKEATNCDWKSWKCKSPLYKPDFSWIANPKDAFWLRLQKLAEFSLGIAKPNGDIPQFGDNDSGRFVNISPIGKFLPKKQLTKRYSQITESKLLPTNDLIYDENDLNQGAFVSAIAGLFGWKNRLPEPMFCGLEYRLFLQVRRNNGLKFNQVETKNQPKNTTPIFSEYRDWPYHKEKIFKLSSSEVALNKDLTQHCYEYFQLSILKNSEIYVALCGISNPNQHHSLSHVHNDKGSVELWFNGEDILLDPGTYLYTPIPALRYKFRSVNAHNTIVVENNEQNKPLSGNMGLFNMTASTKSIGPIIKSNSMEVEIHYGNIKHFRCVTIHEKKVVIEDWCNTEFEQNFNALDCYSNGYGKLIKR